MNDDRTVAEIYAIQATRAARAAIVVAMSGCLATLVLGIGLTWDRHDGPNLVITLGTFGAGGAITAALYAWVSSLQTHAQVRADPPPGCRARP